MCGVKGVGSGLAGGHARSWVYVHGCSILRGMCVWGDVPPPTSRSGSFPPLLLLLPVL